MKIRKGDKLIDLKKYQEFVTKVTSETSGSTNKLHERMAAIDSKSGVNTARLLTGAIGIASEGGELAEIVKKCLFQDKPMSEKTQFHINGELGDIIWYWVNSCTAMGLKPDEVIQENIEKLESRYPGGKFDAHYSENRKEGDL